LNSVSVKKNIYTLLNQPATVVAPQLLGWHLRIGDVTARITETEAYHTEKDLACHASKGRTPRTEGLYARSGSLYVYLCYGMHWMLNFVCDQVDIPSAVLIRSVSINGVDPRTSNGPGKVSKLLGLNQAHHGTHLDDGVVRLLPPATSARLPPSGHQCGPRIGVAYAGPIWANKPWRHWETGFPVALHRPVTAPIASPARRHPSLA
jgi:DNA-3-methyladenine glycosylase